MPLGDSRETIEHDGRILGSGDFVAEIIREAEKKVRRYFRVSEMKTSIDNAIKEIYRKEGIAEQELRMGSANQEALQGASEGFVSSEP